MFIKLIKFYQNYLSSPKPKCKFHPSCSSYAILCFRKTNIFNALRLSIFRILRCNPFSKGGVDFPLGSTNKDLVS